MPPLDIFTATLRDPVWRTVISCNACLPAASLAVLAEDPDSDV